MYENIWDWHYGYKISEFCKYLDCFAIVWWVDTYIIKWDEICVCTHLTHLQIQGFLKSFSCGIIIFFSRKSQDTHLQKICYKWPIKSFEANFIFSDTLVFVICLFLIYSNISVSYQRHLLSKKSLYEDLHVHVPAKNYDSVWTLFPTYCFFKLFEHLSFISIPDNLLRYSRSTIYYFWLVPHRLLL